MPPALGRVAFLVLLAAAPGCKKAAEAPPPPPPPKVGVAKPTVAPVLGYYEYNGTLETTKAVEVRARVKGFLKKVYFVEGTEVRGPDPEASDDEHKFGEKLYAIDPREYKTAVRKAEAELAKAGADILNWKAQIKLAAADVERLTQAGTAASKTELDKAKATLEVNEAELKAAEATREAADASLHTANIQLGYTDVRAPLSGLISRTHVDEENLVGQSEPTLLTTIVRMDELYVFFDAPERDLVDFQRASAAKKVPDPVVTSVPVLVGVTGEDGYPHKGTIDFRENRVDPGTGTIRVRGRVPNPKSGPNNVWLLYPGLYARVRVPAGTPADKPVIPEEALMTGQEGRYVYVVGAENKVTKRTVTVGTQVYRAPPPAPDAPPAAWSYKAPSGAPPGPVVRSVVAIEKGLTKDDVVVIDGLQRVRPGAPVEPQVYELNGPPRAK
ncbi:efflux RND transporter periplasmic adaptor subunit [Urbifossiella limnaea]|uniref:Efflux pump periplasmic linker BepF n=1 Tax=Urbifossiella limnaea TaxID=2528023 RepID=A0A517XSD8_9BACT|nr:efflux RND transporter periplasmic adaptor subunit [Urbifossiella limnaea]QDU20418.1 Efflux pump periplasmic linker BepF [Urbifossiella limnaea]